MNLDFESEELQRYLHHASDTVVRLYSDLDQRNIVNAMDAVAVRHMFDESLPTRGIDLEELINRVEREVFATSTLNISPRFIGYIMSGGNHAGIVADLLTSGLNQNAAKWHLAPAVIEIERTVIRWLCEFIDYPTDAGGALVSGGTVANLHGLATAVVDKAGWNILEDGLSGGPPLTIYVSEQGHAALDSSIALMGLGRGQLRRVPLGPDLTIDLAALERRVEEDRDNGYRPICVIGNAGDHTFGLVDPLTDLAAFCETNDLWFHVDAAWGGPAASTRLAGAMFAGLDRADSVALDCHKWLYVPFDVGCVLVRDAARLRETFSFVPAYLRARSDEEERFEPMEYIFQLSRSARALKVWMTFLAYGANRLRSAIEHNITTMRHMGELIDKAKDFELLAPVPLSSVCFRYRPPELGEQQLNALNQALPKAIEQDGRIFLTGTTIQESSALRACTVNHRITKTDVVFALRVVKEVGRRLLTNL